MLDCFELGHDSRFPFKENETVFDENYDLFFVSYSVYCFLLQVPALFKSRIEPLFHVICESSYIQHEGSVIAMITLIFFHHVNIIKTLYFFLDGRSYFTSDFFSLRQVSKSYHF